MLDPVLDNVSAVPNSAKVSIHPLDQRVPAVTKFSRDRVESISQMAEEDAHTCQQHKAPEVIEMVVLSHEQAPRVLQPRIEPLHFPAATIAA
jgi:hypothetical protein